MIFQDLAKSFPKIFKLHLSGQLIKTHFHKEHLLSLDLLTHKIGAGRQTYSNSENLILE